MTGVRRARAVKALALSVVIALLVAAGLGMSVRSEPPPESGQQGEQGSGGDASPGASPQGRPLRSLTISTQPERRTVAPGHTALFRVDIRRGGSLEGVATGPRQRPAARIRLGAIGALPAGLRASIAPAATRSATSTLRLTAMAGTRLGAYRVRVGARAGHAPGPPRRAEATVTLVVAAPPRSFEIRGALVGLLAPGVDRPVALNLTNPDRSPMRVVDLQVRVHRIRAPRADAAHPCTVADFAVTQFSGAYGFRLPASSTRSLKSLGVPEAGWPRIALINRPVNQDGCKRAALTLRFAGTARGDGS